MKPEVAKNATARERFLREARAAAKLRSDHVVHIYQVGEDRDVVFLAMEFLEGMALDDWLKKGRTPTLAQAVRIGRQIALGLAEAHACGLIHRDVKPGNVWLESRHQGRVKLLDFGLARGGSEQDHQLTQSGTIVGTPAYMAPEQARGEKVDHRADLFSLGVVLYRLTTGRLPFRGDNTLSVLSSLALDTPPAPREVNPEVPPRLSALIERLMAKDRTQRPATAKAVADELAAIEREATQPAPDERTIQQASGRREPAVLTAKTPRPPTARRWLAAASLLLLLGGVAAAVVVIIRDRQGKEVARVHVPEGGTVEVKDGDGSKENLPAKDQPAPQGRADRPKPFVLLRKGAEAGAFKTFAGLWEEHQEGDEILVHGNGPFKLPAVQVKDRALVLRAGHGYRPVFHPDESVFESWKKPLGWLQLEKAALTVDGCDFMRGELPPEMPLGPLVSGGDGPCIARNCRLWGVPFGGPRTSSLTIEDSLLSVGNGMSISLAPGCRATLTNNLLLANSVRYIYPPLIVEAPGGQTVRLARNAICMSAYPNNRSSLLLLRGDDVKGVTVTAENNLFDFTAAGWNIGWPLVNWNLQKNEFVVGAFKERLSWRGKDNWYAGLEGGLKAWNAALAEPEVNSHEVPPLPFGWRVDMPAEADKALPWWQAQLEAARRESGLNDLGPDLSLVGPGDAYLRGLAAEGRPVPKDQLRPEPEAGGRVVLVRGGKAVRGFHLIQDAFNAAQDGDVLEVRTDSLLEGGNTPADRGALTLRAGPGYRPRLKTIVHVARGTALTVEGLSFADDASLLTEPVKDLPLEKQARVPRLAYCALGGDPRWPLGGWPSVQCLFLSRDGTPGEVVRCVSRGYLALYSPKGSHVRLRECVGGSGVVAISGFQVVPALGTVELEACAFMQHGTANMSSLFWAWERLGPDECSWITRRCLLHSNAVLRSGGDQLGAAGKHWTGEKNLYLVGGSWDGANSRIGSLAQWRAFWKSPETGSVEGDPPIARPQNWKLRAGGPPSGAGPDVDRVARPAAPAKE
jgi:hypothetical protein